tara:strand:- start:540 stop:866 length:327 start_codon:yes stop_codon:yes gene_type:complete
MAEKKRWLRNIVDGEIYGWNEILAENPRTEEVTEEEAFPEKFMTKKQRGRPPKVDLQTDDIPDPKGETPPELAEEASKGLERARNDKGHYIADDPNTPDVNEAWVEKK